MTDTAILANDHVVAARADLLLDGVIIQAAIPVTSGSVDIDGSAARRRRFKGVVVDETGVLKALSGSDRLAPYGAELALYRGHQGRQWPLGVIRLEEASTDWPGKRIAVSGQDRSVVVADATFEVPKIIAAGTNVGTAIADVLTTAYPAVVLNLVSTAEITPLLVFAEGEDPWVAATEMATSIGMELFFDAGGRATMRPPPSLVDAEPVASYIEGVGSTIIDLGVNLSAVGLANRVVVTSAATTTAPVRGVATDDDPASPTYYDGSFGRRTLHIRDEKVRTVAQAEAVARLRLAEALAPRESADISALVDPRREAGDVVLVDVGGWQRLASIATLSMPLGPTGTMRLTTGAIVAAAS